jgi:hypothetical protein
MLKRILRNATFILGATYSILWYSEQLNRRIQKLADTETVTNEWAYIAVKLARGHYRELNDIETMKYDYKFFKVISKYHE